MQVSAASGSPSKGPSQVAYGIALAAALSVEDPFMQTDNLQVSLMFMPLNQGDLHVSVHVLRRLPPRIAPRMHQTGVCLHLAEHANTAASRGAG